MLVCQWHLDTPYGKQAEEAPQFRRHSDGLAPLVVPGSQHWIVYRVLEAPAG